MEKCVGFSCRVNAVSGLVAATCTRGTRRAVATVTMAAGATAVRIVSAMSRETDRPSREASVVGESL